ncbi:hypothetical protein Q9189_008191, partial [Teloschistes chrysophthalmus]
MSVDHLPIVAPARVNVICVPTGRIEQSRFLVFFERLRQENVVQLRDVSPDNRPHRTMFSPLAFPSGRVFFDLKTSAPPASHLALSPFEVYRQPLVIIGLADGQSFQDDELVNGSSSKEDDGDAAVWRLSTDSVQQLLQDRQDLASNFSSSLVHNILVFDCAAPDQRLPEGLTPVPSTAMSKATTMKTVMCDLASQLLAEMASFAKSLQESGSIETPRVPRQNIQRPLARYSQSSTPAATDPNLSLREQHKNDHRMSMPAHLLENLGSRSSTPRSRPESPLTGMQSPLSSLDGVQSSPASPPSIPVDRPRPMSRDRATMQGFGSNSLTERERNKSRGRTHIVIGSLYLLAGRWPDAVRDIVDGAIVAKTNSDHIWHGKALEYLLIICLLYAWAGLDFRIPHLIFEAAERTSTGPTKASKDTPASSHADLTKTQPGQPTTSTLQTLSTLVPELATSIQNLYSRAWTFSEDKLPQLSFSETGLRFSKLLVVLLASDGKLTDLNLNQIIGGQRAENTTARPQDTIGTPKRDEIAAFLLRSYPNTDTDPSMTVADRTAILAGIAAILAELGYQRKKAFVLKELLEGLVPALVDARKKGAADMGVHPAASLASLDVALIGARSQSSELPFGEEEGGLQDFMTIICRSYGIQLRLDPQASTADQTIVSEGIERLEGTSQQVVHIASGKLTGPPDLKIDILRSCIRVCEALPDLEGVLRFSAELLRTSGSGIAPGPEDNNGSSSLSIEDQLRLWGNIHRTVGVARQLGLADLAAEYWDGFLLRRIDAFPFSSDSPIPHAKDELEVVAKIAADTNTGPFLYNPFGQTNRATTTKPLIVADEEAVFRVTLQNLYDFDLEIESIRLKTDKDGCQVATQDVVVGPYRTQSFYLTAVPSEAGSLTVGGCYAKIRGCYERFFPLFDAPWSLKPSVKSLQVDQAERNQNPPDKKESKNSKEPVPSSVAVDVIPALPKISLKAMSLSQSATMLLEGETKKFSITLSNASSNVPADLVLLTFEDSAAVQLQEAMGSKELPAIDLHELQLAAAKKPLKWCPPQNNPEVVIDPGKEITLEMEVTGKPGLSDATIHVSYGHLGVSRSEIKDRFYTRKLSIPLAIAVNASIDVFRTNILPFSTSFAWQNQQRQLSGTLPPSAKKESPPIASRRPSSMSSRSKSLKLSANNDNRFQSLLSRIGLSPNDKSHCLLCLDCRNSWPTPLSISIQVRSSSSSTADLPETPMSPTSSSPTTSKKSNDSSTSKTAYTVHESLQPGHTKRILVLLPRIRLPASHCHAPVPSPDPSKKNQQFIMSAGPKKTYEAEIREREGYWYREALLGLLHATWTEESTGRKGVINLRSIRLAERMIDTLKLPEVEVEMTLSLSSSSTTSSPASDHTSTSSSTTSSSSTNPPLTRLTPTLYLAPLHHPLTLTTRITNHTSFPLNLLLRLQPRLVAQGVPHTIALDLQRRFLVQGVCQKGLGVVEAGGGWREWGVEVWVLGGGRWGVGGVVEEVVVGG